ncbi:MAG: class I SAM-dependent methyltransferase [Turicibacter sp.]|nr:class I SAM-dependent methyltransferase [Turicibacter sp.]
MTSYNSFAYYYDQMMADVDYNYWLHQVKENVQIGSRVLDVGCGTGTLSLALTDAGYAVTGLDLSADMLVVASEKAKDAGVAIDLIQRDMRELEGLSGYDGILIAVDSLNYLETEADVIRTFAGCYEALKAGGVLIFDVHTPFKMRETFKDYLYVENDDALTYIWHVEEGEQPLSVVHELTIFARAEDGSYVRTVEYHEQRTFEMHEYKAWLDECGFRVVNLTGDEDRQLFVVRKVGRDDE